QLSPISICHTEHITVEYSLYSIVHLSLPFFFSLIPPPPRSTLFPYTTLFRSTSPWSTPRTSPDKGSYTTYAARLCPCPPRVQSRSEEHTSELQSRSDLVCRLLLEKKKKTIKNIQKKNK